MATVTGLTLASTTALGEVPAGNVTHRRGLLRWLKLRDQGLGLLTPNLYGDAFSTVATIRYGVWGEPQPPVNSFYIHTGVTPDDREFPGWSATTVWANRFWVVPLEADLKTILADTEGYFQLFSTFRNTAQTLQSIVASGSGYDGTIVLERVSGSGTITATFGASVLPRVFNPRTGQTYRYTVLGEGDPDIDIDLTFDVLAPDVGDPVLNIVGTRALVFPFISQKPVSEKISFLTNVLESRDGTEQRITTRTSPRQTYGMNYYLTGPDREEQFQLVQSLIVGRGATPLGVGLWHQARKITANSAIGSDTITIDTSGMDFRVGEFVLLYKEWNDNEIGKIITVSANSITLSSGVTQEFVTGDYCVPAQLCVASDGTKFVESLRNLSTVEVDWNPVSVTSTLSDHTALYPNTWSPPGSTYDPMPLVVDANFVGKSGLEQHIHHDFDVIDAKTGSIKYLSRKETPSVSYQKSWETDGNNAINDAMALRKFLYWSKGRLKSFWMPSEKPDFTVIEDVLQSIPDLIVRTSGYSDKIGVKAPYDHIRISYTSGSGIADTYHKITSVQKGFPTEDKDTLHITHGTAATQLSGFANGFTVADVVSVQFLFRVRFSSDMGTITHTGQGRTSLSMPVAGVKQIE